MLRHDRRGTLRFAALQSAPAQEYLALRGLRTDDFESLVFVPDWNDRARSGPVLRTAGALAAAAELGGPWACLSLVRIVPSPVRDLAYRAIARMRNRLFGPYRPAGPRNPAWDSRFLDNGRLDSVAKGPGP